MHFILSNRFLFVVKIVCHENQFQLQRIWLIISLEFVFSWNYMSLAEVFRMFIEYSYLLNKSKTEINIQTGLKSCWEKFVFVYLYVSTFCSWAISRTLFNFPSMWHIYLASMFPCYDSISISVRAIISTIRRLRYKWIELEFCAYCVASYCVLVDAVLYLEPEIDGTAVRRSQDWTLYLNTEFWSIDFHILIRK